VAICHEFDGGDFAVSTVDGFLPPDVATSRAMNPGTCEFEDVRI